MNAVHEEMEQTRAALKRGDDSDAKVETCLSLGERPQKVHVRYRDGRLELVYGLGGAVVRVLPLPDEIMDDVLALVFV